MLAEAVPLTESRSIYLSPLYLSYKTIQACRSGGGRREQQSVEKRKCESEYKTHKHAVKRTTLVTFQEREQNPGVKFPDCCPLVITMKQ